jgi:hypothetical protein
MEDISENAYAGLGVPGFLCRADGDPQGAIRAAVLAHERRRVVHINVTEHPTAEWTAQQVIDAFPWDEAPRYLLRDRDRIYSASFRQRVRHMDSEDVLIAPRSPWQHPYVERVIGASC